MQAYGLKRLGAAVLLLALGLGLSATANSEAAGNVSASLGWLSSSVSLEGTAGHRPALLATNAQAGRHHYWLDVATNSTGAALSVPVIDIIGGANADEQPVVIISAAVHGDELNGIRVIHQLADALEGLAHRGLLSGRVVMLPGVNQTGMAASNRHFIGSAGGGTMADLNRLFAAPMGQGPAAQRFASALYSQLASLQPVRVVDLHTQTSGTAYPLFVFADFNNSKAREMAFLAAPDVIKDDPGQAGTLETRFIEAGVPAITLEVGEAKRFQADLIERAEAGLLRILADADVLAPGGVGDVGAAISTSQTPFVGAKSVDIVASSGGTAVIEVALLQQVEPGDVLARVYDAFGRLLEEHVATDAGLVLAVATDPLREPGALLVRILEPAHTELTKAQ